MKISELTDEVIKEFCGIDEDTNLIELYKGAAIAYIKEHTVLKTDEQLNTHEDITFACVVLINDMSLNRDFTVSRDMLNPTVSRILALYADNLVAGGEE